MKKARIRRLKRREPAGSGHISVSVMLFMFGAIKGVSHHDDATLRRVVQKAGKKARPTTFRRR